MKRGRQFNRLRRYADVLNTMEQAGISSHPLEAFCRVPDDKVAREASEIILDLCAAKAMLSPRKEPAYTVPCGKAIEFGNVKLPLSVFIKPTVLIGQPGVGKTCALGLLISQARNFGINVEFEDHKGEGRRLLNVLPETRVFRVSQLPDNLLELFGEKQACAAGQCNEIAKLFSVRPETFPIFPKILLGMEASRGLNDPPPSPKDFERVLRKLGSRNNNKKFWKASDVLGQWNAQIGKAAYIRSLSKEIGGYGLKVIEYMGQNPRFQRAHAGIRLHQRMMAQSVGGFASKLHLLYVIDEGSFVFSKELSGTSGSLYVPPQKRLITQVRAYGIGVVVGIQSLADVDPNLISNVATILIFRIRDPRDAIRACRLIGLPEDRHPEIQKLPVGTCYIVSEGFNRPVRVDLPYYDLGPYPSDEEVAAKMKPEFDRIARNTIYAPMDETTIEAIPYLDVYAGNNRKQPESTRKQPPPKPELTPEQTLFILEIKRHPAATTSEHYRNLGWGVGKGQRIKNSLIESGRIYVDRRPSPGGRPREILLLSNQELEESS